MFASSHTETKSAGVWLLPIVPYFGNFVWCTHRRFVENILTKTKMDKKRVKKIIIKMEGKIE